MKSEFEITQRTKLKRLPERASYQRAQAYAILDEGLICHVGIADETGVVVLPMCYARDGNTLILHGSVASRLMQRMEQGIDLCVTVTLLDGLVLARSVFDHSMNYRSVMIFGTAHSITDKAHKRQALERLTEHLVPGRWADARQPDSKELAATLVMALPLEQASTKVRSGPPSCPAKDKDTIVWSGVIPLTQIAQTPIPDPTMDQTLPTPAYAQDYRRKAES